MLKKSALPFLKETWLILVAILGFLLNLTECNELYRYPSGLSHTVFTYREKCYQFVDNEQHWQEGQTYCSNAGGRMLEVYDQSTMDFIKNRLNVGVPWTNDGVWIGTNDIHSEGSWVWASGAPMSYTYWNTNEPADTWPLYHLDCGVMRRENSWRWGSYPCQSASYHYKYICMYNMSPTTTANSSSATTPTITVSPSLSSTTLSTHSDQSTPTSSVVGDASSVAVSSTISLSANFTSTPLTDTATESQTSPHIPATISTSDPSQSTVISSLISTTDVASSTTKMSIMSDIISTTTTSAMSTASADTNTTDFVPTSGLSGTPTEPGPTTESFTKATTASGEEESTTTEMVTSTKPGSDTGEATSDASESRLRGTYFGIILAGGSVLFLYR